MGTVVISRETSIERIFIQYENPGMSVYIVNRKILNIMKEMMKFCFANKTKSRETEL